MIHNLPEVPLFRDSVKTDIVQEVALRVVIELPGWEMYAVGTASLIGGYLAVTAKHVLEYALRKYGQRGPNGEVIGHTLKLVQVLPGPIYNIFRVMTAWVTSSDIAILHLAQDGSSAPEQKVNWRGLMISVLPPSSGQKVIAFGYRESKIEVTETPGGGHHIEINDIGTTSAGVVGTIFPERRDSSMLSFPCFEINARFAPGMSGGLVIDEEGRLCGLVCAGINFQDPNDGPLSYAATLWPMLTANISADREGSYPRGVEYPMIDLALGGQISVVGLEHLDPRHFPDRTLSSG
jgi:hypothetical protein